MPIFGNQQELDLTLFVDRKLIFKNPQSGRIKKIKAGFSWLGFLFDWITLLFKGLTGRGLMVLGFNIAAPIINMFVNEHTVYRYSRFGEDNNETVIAVALLLLSVWLVIKIVIGVKANLWQANDLIKRGWLLQNAAAAKSPLDGDWRELIRQFEAKRSGSTV